MLPSHFARPVPKTNFGQRSQSESDTPPVDLTRTLFFCGCVLTAMTLKEQVCVFGWLVYKASVTYSITEILSPVLTSVARFHLVKVICSTKRYAGSGLQGFSGVSHISQSRSSRPKCIEQYAVTVCLDSRGVSVYLCP